MYVIGGGEVKCIHGPGKDTPQAHTLITCPPYDSKAGIEAQITSLQGLNQLIRERQTAGYDRQERLHEFLILGRWYSDTCGNWGEVSVGSGRRELRPIDLNPKLPAVMTKEEFLDYLEQTGRTELEKHFCVTMGHSIPRAQVPCPCCAARWTISDCDQAVRVDSDEKMDLDAFAGKTFAEFRYALSQRTDAIYFIPPERPLRADRFIDLRPRPDHPQAKINERGWVAIPGGDAYVIQPGDQASVHVARFFHPNCHAEKLRKKIEDRFASVRERFNLGATDVGMGNGNFNLAGELPNVATRCCRQELLQAGIPAVEAEPSGEVQSRVNGTLRYTNGTKVTFQRAWYYWMVSSSAPLPFEAADKLNKQFGRVVRVSGYAGGTSVPKKGVSSWHVDTDLGLYVLVKTLNEQFGEPLKA